MLQMQYVLYVMYMYRAIYNMCVCMYIYSLVAGVSFDLFDSLYKPDAPKTTTVHVSDTRTDMLHCTTTRWGLWLKHLAPDYKSIITPHYRALAVYAHSMGCYN